MRVAIDIGPMASDHKVRGIGVCTSELINQLAHLAPKRKKIKIETVDFSKVDLSKYDLAHYQWFHPFFNTLPDNYPTKSLITIHDLTQLACPKHYPPGIRGRLKFFNQKRRAQNATAIITISETSKKDIVRFLDIAPEKIHVVYVAPRKVFKRLSSNKLQLVAKKYNLPSKFIFYVGYVDRNKNILSLSRACRLLKMPLVIAGKQALEVTEVGLDWKIMHGPMDWLRYVLGKPHPEIEHFGALAREFKKSRVKCLGFVPDEDLAAIYNLATLYVQPSFYEGFGLPVLEAMACGTPVIINRTNALVEIAGDAAEIVDARNSQKLAKQIANFLKDSKKQGKLVKRGLKRAREFSWQKTARETLDVYKKLIEK